MGTTTHVRCYAGFNTVRQDCEVRHNRPLRMLNPGNNDAAFRNLRDHIAMPSIGHPVAVLRMVSKIGYDSCGNCQHDSGRDCGSYSDPSQFSHEMPTRSCGEQFRYRPNVIRDARFHRRGYPNRAVNSAEVVIRKMQG